MPRPSETVEAFLARLDHPLKVEIEAVRAIVLGANEHLTEHIKWNAPSFCYLGDDRVTFKLHPPDKIQLVLHRGAKVKASKGFAFADDTGILKWVAADRAVVTLTDMHDINAKRDRLATLIDRWVKATNLAAEA